MSFQVFIVHGTLSSHPLWLPLLIFFSGLLSFLAIMPIHPSKPIILLILSPPASPIRVFHYQSKQEGINHLSDVFPSRLSSQDHQNLTIWPYWLAIYGCLKCLYSFYKVYFLFSTCVIILSNYRNICLTISFVRFQTLNLILDPLLDFIC